MIILLEALRIGGNKRSVKMSYEVGIMIGSVGILWFLSFIAMSLDEEHNILRFFFMMMAFWVVVIISNLAYTYAVDNGASANVTNMLSTFFTFTTTIVIIITSYFSIYYLWKVFKLAVGLYKQKKGDTQYFKV